MSKEYDTEFTCYITCPHCGYEDYDSWEFEGDDGEEIEQECGSCEKEFYATRSITVDYSTRKKEDGLKLKITDHLVSAIHSSLSGYVNSIESYIWYSASRSQIAQVGSRVQLPIFNSLWSPICSSITDKLEEYENQLHSSN